MVQQISYRQYSGTAAENYQRYFVPTIAIPVTADLLRTAEIQSGERVLDVACGTGVIARLAAEQVGPGGTVVGVDVAPDMIEVARATPGPADITIEWREGDAESLPLQDASFDVVLSQMGLMFIDDKPAALSEMRRVLTAGGRLALNTPGTIQRLMEILDEGLARHISPDLAGFVPAVFSLHDPSVIERLLHDAGFHDVRSEVTTTTVRLAPPIDFLWQYINLTPMGAFVNQTSDQAQTALERDVVDKWQEFVESGSTVMHQPMVIASARTCAAVAHRGGICHAHDASGSESVPSVVTAVRRKPAYPRM